LPLGHVAPLFLGALGIASIGLLERDFALVLFASCAAGFGVVSGQNCANAFAANFYPTYIRATGVGWALGIGRIGAIVGPSIGGAMLALHFNIAEIFSVGAVASLIAVLAVLALWYLDRANDNVLPVKRLQQELESFGSE
jgi:AAHS family 4-hydroxybenzoate transporter-like MFS transporter